MASSIRDHIISAGGKYIVSTKTLYSIASYKLWKVSVTDLAKKYNQRDYRLGQLRLE